MHTEEDLTPHERLANPAALAREIVQLPAESMAPVLDACMKVINEYRNSHRGYVPLEIFPSVLGIAGQYTCMEALIRVVDSDNHPMGFLLKRRGESEHEWNGQYAIPGVAIFPVPHADMISLANERLMQALDIIHDEDLGLLRHERTIFECHDEPERNTTCLTVVKLFDISFAQATELVARSDNWKLYSRNEFHNDNRIVDHHRATLDWAVRSDLGVFEMVDLRNNKTAE